MAKPFNWVSAFLRKYFLNNRMIYRKKRTVIDGQELLKYGLGLKLENLGQYAKSLSHIEYQIPSIYLSIGLGVHQGEAVAFRQMAVGGRHWVVSKLRFDDLSQYQASIVIGLHHLALLLDIYQVQPDLVKKDLLTKNALELGRYYCQLMQSPNLSNAVENEQNNPEVEGSRQQDLSQLLRYLKQGLKCPCCKKCITIDDDIQLNREE